jgi:ATP-dependent Lhr-like helicase
MKNFPFRIIHSDKLHSDIKLIINGYIKYNDPLKKLPFELISNNLFQLLRTKSNLIFTNSRNTTEKYALALKEHCDKLGLPNEFFPHHSSLSKDIREELEQKLQKAQYPTTAICTSTLELGIDVGHVNSIAQISAPKSVSSLKQRLGRSGRRDSSSILRFFITENEIDSSSSIGDSLRLMTFQSIAMINLLLAKWCESPNITEFHFSTLIQQLLSVIAQYGGINADQLFTLLCLHGPFSRVNSSDFKLLLLYLDKSNLITQLGDGVLVLSDKGNNLVSHFSFYSAFPTMDEYTLVCNNKILGTIPILNTIDINNHLIFAGQRWVVVDISPEKKLIALKPSSGGRPPYFPSTSQLLDDRVRQEMYQIYKTNKTPIFLNKTAQSLFSEGITSFNGFNLANENTIKSGKNLYLLPWLGDRTINAIIAFFSLHGIKSEAFSGIIEFYDITKDDLLKATKLILKNPKPSFDILTSNKIITFINKNDHYLPDILRHKDYASHFFDIDTAWSWIGNFN